MSTPENNLRVDYIEFATSNVARANKFYTEAFGWKFTDYGPDYTSFTDGRMTGGFFNAPAATAAKEPAPMKMNPMVVIFAVDLESAAERVTRAGGKIIKPAFEFPGGRRFQFADPNGLELSVWSDVRVDGSKIS